MYHTVSQSKIWLAFISTILLHILSVVCLSFAPALKLKPMVSKPITIKFVTPPKQELQVVEQPKITEEIPQVIAKVEPIVNPVLPKNEPPPPKPKKQPKKKPKPKPKPKNEPKPKQKLKEKPAQKPQTKLLNTKADAQAKQREIDRQNEIARQNEIEKQLELKRQQELAKQQRLEQERLEKEQAEQEERERLERENQAREEQQRQEAERVEAKRKAQAGQTITARYSYEAKAKYPPRELRFGKTGVVSFEFVISIEGKAKNIQVISSTSNAFKKSALKALKSSKFHVTKIDGVAVEQKAKKTIKFELN